MMIRKMQAVAVIMVSLFLFSSCMEDFGVTSNIKPEELKHYDLTGAYVYGSIKTKRFSPVSRMSFFFKNSSDLNFLITDTYQHFLLDMPLTCKGLSKVDISWYDSEDRVTKTQSFYPDIPFTLVSNKINYIGVYFIEELNKLVVTNYLEADKADFYTNYIQITNYEFYPVEMKK